MPSVFFFSTGVLHIKLTATGLIDPCSGDSCHGDILVNGEQFCPCTRGLIYVRFDYRSGVVEFQHTWDTHGDSSAADNGAYYLNETPEGKVGLIVTRDAARKRFNPNLINSMVCFNQFLAFMYRLMDSQVKGGKQGLV